MCINTFENYPNQLVNRFNAENYRSFIASTVQSDQVVESNNQLPSVIIWNPIVLPVFQSVCQLKCPICQSKLRFWKWKDGQTERDIPRKLYCIQEQVLLVSSVYLCEKHHQVLSHHPSVLEEVRKVPLIVPFVLFHKSGVTRELYNYISISIHTGICIQDIENMLINLHQHQLQMQMCYQMPSRQSACDNRNFCEINKEFIGRKLISSIFIRSFIESEHMYTDHMSQKRGKWISFDHTFKVAANIGYWKNGLWVRMYDSLFIIMNEESDIIGWQFTKGTSITKVENLLQGLKKRYNNCMQGEQMQGIVVDNCCLLRNAINKIFGIKIPVKLDIFHAIQRIVKGIPKRQNNALIKQLRKQLLKDLRLCFRSPGDTGETRKCVTPEKEIIEKNVLKFVEKWKIQEVDNIKVLPQAAIDAVDKLFVHITSGCLSGIPPGIGTNRNERLHRKIRKWLNRTRIGVCLAVALLSTVFYHHMDKNSHVKEVGRNAKKVTPISQWYQKFITGGGKSSEERFGIGVHINSASSEIQQCAYETLEHFESISGVEDDETNLECSDSDSEDEISSKDIENIIDKANMMANVVNDTYAKGKAPITTNKNFWVHSPSVLLMFSNPLCDGAVEKTAAEKHLDGLLERYGFKRKEVPGNGDCCFLAVSNGIESFLQDVTQETICSHFRSLGFFIGQSVEERVALIRSLVVQEFLGEHSKDYSMFLVNSSEELYEEMALSFLNSGYFDCELGNGMLLALANVLNCTIIVFTSIDSYPVIPIVPRSAALSSVPLYVAYNNSGKGHYNAVHVISEKLPSDVQQEKSTCRCGRGGAHDKTKEFCHTYASRCKCFQSLGGCNDGCHCVNCANPYGQKNCETADKPERKRKRYHNTPKSSLEFMQKKGEPLAPVKWTDYEHFILQQIVDIVVDDDSNPDYTKIHKLFLNVLSYKNSNINLPHLSLTVIKTKVNYILRDRTVFMTTLQQELGSNWL